jgi:hypothetical protein
MDGGIVPVEMQRDEIALRRAMLGLPESGGPRPEQIFDYTQVRLAIADLDTAHWQPSE